MQNLRIVNVNVVSSSSIEVIFTHALTTNLVASNVLILSNSVTIPNSDVLKVTINNEMLTIYCKPLTPIANYTISLHSVAGHPFISKNNDAILVEDGVTNKYSILGPIEPENPIKNYLVSLYNDSVFNVSDPNTNVSKYIDSLAKNLAKVLADIRQLKNENYLSYTVVDEQKTRGEGPFDRLNEEAAYEILRVGLTPTNSIVANSAAYIEFPKFPVTLQKQPSTEKLISGTTNDLGIFDLNTLTLNLQNKNVTKLVQLKFTFVSSLVYTYDFTILGYQLLSSRYDQDYSSSYLTLNSNQLRLNSAVLSDLLFDINHISRIDITYEYKDLGIVVDPLSVDVYDIRTAIREVLPPIVNVFNLKNAPLVDNLNNVLSINGLTIYNPNSNNHSSHPAFLNEIPFRFNALPSYPGQYSVDYNTGTVYVYGESLVADGTGPTPPLVTYNYRYNFTAEQDYVYDSDLLDMVALPNGNLISNPGTISFNFEKVLVPDVDYKAEIHIENLSERINNNLVAFNTLKVQNQPITNVFKIFNETSGEIYSIDRWNDDKVYFKYNTPPKTAIQLKERASFKSSNNELLAVNSIITNASSIKVFKLLLANNNVVSASEDCIASKNNTSINFSDLFTFKHERWFNSELNETLNTNILTSIGDYCIDYFNGVVYCAVSNSQSNNIGYVSYKYKDIALLNPHIISVDNLYYQINPLTNKNKMFSYLDFSDGSIIPSTLDLADERYLNDVVTSVYTVNAKAVGTYSGISFIPGVSDSINYIRSLYEYSDLTNNIYPINFSNACILSDNKITINTITKTVYENVKYDGVNYYVDIPENIGYISSNINYTFSVIRSSDSAQLWDNSAIFVVGNYAKLKLSGVNSPVVGQAVTITYGFAIKDLSRIVVDYDKGGYYIDYTYLADEIIVSYEYGDNVLDFRTGDVSANTTYYVTYKAGALRDALLKNFGTLVNVSELSSFDTDVNRETYRDSLSAALTSFLQGPTVSAISNIAQTISHIKPEITESIFDGWSLGNSLLSIDSVTSSGDFQLVPGKFNNGVLINSPAQSVTLPVNSNLRLEEGTFESWIIPQWNGLDKDVALSFSILENSLTVDPLKVFIGAKETHPVLNSDGSFTISEIDSGIPNIFKPSGGYINRDGIFIYYGPDLLNASDGYKWNVIVKSGYLTGTSSSFRINVTSSGSLYDLLSSSSYINYSKFTGQNSFKLNIIGSGAAYDITSTFVSDNNKYLLDVGEQTKNRLSLFKDPSGYLNLRAIDKNGVPYIVDYNLSKWIKGQAHHIAASWKLNTLNNRDELHLFVDGKEVPNVIKYGQKLNPYSTQKFATISTENIIASTTKDIISSNDMVTVLGSNTVTALINFGTLNITSGDTLFINEAGFSTLGYTISSVSGQSLVLSTTMPASLPNARFTVNKTNFTVSSEIDLYSNITVSKLSYILNGADLDGYTGDSYVTSTTTSFSSLSSSKHYVIKVDDSSLPEVYDITGILPNKLFLNKTLTANILNKSFRIYDVDTEVEIPGLRAVNPSYSISKVSNNTILTMLNSVTAGDLLLLRTLGLNFRNINAKYYTWSNNLENILMTRIPAPVSLDDVLITKVLLDSTAIGPSNSSLVLGKFNSNNLVTDQPTNQITGRTLSVTISGTNVDFSANTIVNIDGYNNATHYTESLIFTDYGTKSFANFYTSVSFVNVVTKPINSIKDALVLKLKESNVITYQENDGYHPVIKYSYFMDAGNKLENDGYDLVKDSTKLFSGADTTNYMLIISPPSVAGYYSITNISSDRKDLQLYPYNAAATLPLPAFTNGKYEILNTTAYRSGLQEGLFTFEHFNRPGIPYNLSKGFYEISYRTYLSVKMDPFKDKVYIGSDINKSLHINAIVDQSCMYSVKLTDTRIGESIPSIQRSVTKDFNSLKPLVKDKNTLFLLDFNSYPFSNTADYYKTIKDDKNYFLSSSVVNDNFNYSLSILDKPIIKSNDGILNTSSEGTIEFWVSPLFDTGNDPNERYYFDAFSAVTEEMTSHDNASIVLNTNISKILSVTVKGDPSLDYFAGGKIDYQYDNAVSEQTISITKNKVVISSEASQIISVKIIGDFSQTDYFIGGIIASDGKTIYLGKNLPYNSANVNVIFKKKDGTSLNKQVIRLNKKLPYQNTKVMVTYLPAGIQGDRLSIFKDKAGTINFSIMASGLNYTVKGPARWTKDTWHRIKASYKVNDGYMKDEMRLFIDGYEYSNIRFGTGFILGSLPIVIGSSSPGDSNVLTGTINFKDQINTLYIGASYNNTGHAYSLVDNLRISNVSRPLYAPYGEPLDVNYSTNTQSVVPVTTDLYTTYLLDFNEILQKNIDFVILRNRNSGIFDFSIKIFDSLDIINSNAKTKQILEKLIKILKPANSRVLISYE